MTGQQQGDHDVVVIGGGIIGLAVAERLQSRGRSVLLLERGQPGCGATWAAGGMLAPISEAELVETELVDLGLDSVRRYPEWIARLERATGLRCGYRTDGTLWIATNRDDAEELEHLEATLRGRGLPVERLGGAAVREREPHLSGRVLGGLLLAGDHQVDPRALTLALVQSLRERGGRLIAGSTVEAVESEGGRVGAVRGTARDGQPFEWRARQVVVATGAWTDRDLRLPLETPSLRPVKGQLVRLRGEALLRHVVRTPDAYLIPRESGELLIGATMEEMGFDEQRTAGAVMDLLRHAWEALPGVYDLELAEISVGLRSAHEDHLPRIGPTSLDGLFLALGHFRNGVLLAAATAHHLASLMDGDPPAAVVAPFVPRVAVPAGAAANPRRDTAPEAAP